MNEEEKNKLIHDIDECIKMLEGPYNWLDSKCYWLGMFIGDNLSQRFHAWHSRLEFKIRRRVNE